MNSTEIKSLEDYKAACMTRPQDYAEFTEQGFDEGWGMSHVSTHRDVGLRVESNWEVQTTDLLARFPNSFYIQRSSHWAVGWSENLRVKMDDEEAVEAAYEWYCKLQDYPVADEDDWSRREQEAFDEAWDDWGYRDFQAWALENEIEEVTELDEDGERVFIDTPEMKDAAYSAFLNSGPGDAVRMDNDDRSVVMDYSQWVADDRIIALRHSMYRYLERAAEQMPVQQCLACPCGEPRTEHYFSPRYEVARYLDCPVHGRVTVYMAKEA